MINFNKKCFGILISEDTKNFFKIVILAPFATVLVLVFWIYVFVCTYSNSYLGLVVLLTGVFGSGILFYLVTEIDWSHFDSCKDNQDD